MSKLCGRRDLQEVIRSGDGVFVLFYATWCPFSLAFLPIYEKCARGRDREFVRITLEGNEDLFAEHLIEVYPTVHSEWAERILAWRHTGFNVHSRVRARTKIEAERVGKYMVRPVLSLERLSLDEREGKVGYRWGREAAELETMDYLEFIARVVSHIPDKGQVMVRYYGLYANAHRGKVRKASRVPVALGMIEEEPPRVPSKGWAEMIRKVYEVDPLICPRCGGRMKVVAFLTEYAVVDRIIRHLELTFAAEKPPPSHVFEPVALMAAEEGGDYE
jgi:thiol-disulfide isomerase/thioredoxin